MTIAQLLLALRARFRAFVLILAATVIAAVAVSLVLPKSYKATVGLLVDARGEQSMHDTTVPFNFNLPQERQSYLQTQAEIVGSPSVARKVVEDLGLAQQPKAQADFQKDADGKGAIEDWLAEGLLKKLKVEVSQSNVIQATFTSPDPEYSARVANAFAKAYRDTIVALRSEPTREAATWFDEQLKSLKANLTTAQDRLTDYLQRQKIASLDERNDVDIARLGALGTQAVTAQEQALQWNSRVRQGNGLARDGNADRLPEVRDNALVQKLKADLATGEAKLQELATQYGSNYPLYQRQESQNKVLRERLDAETRRVAAGVGAAARQSRQRETDIAGALAAQRARVLAQRESRDEINVLKHDVDAAEKAYDVALQRAAVTQVESRARETNVAVLNPAVAPRLPSSPKLLLNIALAVVLGTALGVGIVMLIELADRRVRSHADLDNAWDVPLLGVLHEWQPSSRALPDPGNYAGRLPRPA